MKGSLLRRKVRTEMVKIDKVVREIEERDREIVNERVKKRWK